METPPDEEEKAASQPIHRPKPSNSAMENHQLLNQLNDSPLNTRTPNKMFSAGEASPIPREQGTEYV